MSPLHVLALVLGLGSVDGFVTMAANYERTRDGPCIGEPDFVTCSVTGSSLRWTITNTSSGIPVSNTITLFANPNHVGRRFVIATATIDLEFYQNETSACAISSEMHFSLEAHEFVDVLCTDENLMGSDMKISPLGTPATPVDFREARNSSNNENSIHILQWDMANDRGLEEFLLIINGSETRPIFRELNTTFYEKSHQERVTLSLTAKNQCGVRSIETPPLDLEIGSPTASSPTAGSSPAGSPTSGNTELSNDMIIAIIVGAILVALALLLLLICLLVFMIYWINRDKWFDVEDGICLKHEQKKKKPTWMMKMNARVKPTSDEAVIGKKGIKGRIASDDCEEDKERQTYADAYDKTSNCVAKIRKDRNHPKHFQLVFRSGNLSTHLTAMCKETSSCDDEMCLYVKRSVIAQEAAEWSTI